MNTEFTFFLTQVGHLANVKNNQRRFAPMLPHITGIIAPHHRNTQRRQFLDITGRQIWQIAAGDGTERNYRDVLLEWDIVAIGGGGFGRWPTGRAQYLEKRGLPQVRIVEKFVSEMETGDIVVLRVGKNQVYGLGLVESEYLWLDDMGDVDGWDLQHCRRIKWVWKYAKDAGPHVFPTGALRWGDTVQKAKSPELTKWIQEQPLTESDLKRPLVTLPATCVDGNEFEAVSLDEISQYLYDQGVAADNIDSLTVRMADLVRTAGWYTRTDTQPAERETVAYLVVPLLRSLGWTPQRMAIEWSRIDIALFDALPREDGNLVAAVEAKKRWRTCLNSCSQVFGYALTPERHRCRRAISTEGISYAAFRRDGGNCFEETPEAYLNLTRMVSDYPLIHCAGAKEALSLMSADWRE